MIYPSKRKSGFDQVIKHLPYFVEWRKLLWTPPVRWLLGDPKRFAGKRVLEIGCRSGRMSCFFGMLGAEVVGADFDKVSLEKAQQEAERWGVTDKVRFCHYTGSPASIPATDFDFIFTKSVLVLIPDLEPFLEDLSTKMRPGGELITVENSSSGAILYLLRRRLRTGSKKKAVYLRGVNETFLAAVNHSFHIEAQKEYFGIVTAIRARKS